MCEHLPAATLAVRFETAAIASARRFVREQVCPVHGFERPAEAQLVVSELVTNGIQHGAPPILLTVDCRGAEGTMLTVTDASRTGVRLPVQTVDPLAESGRGVMIVDYISRAWGVVSDHDGKQVWALV